MVYKRPAAYWRRLSYRTLCSTHKSAQELISRRYGSHVSQRELLQNHSCADDQIQSLCHEGRLDMVIHLLSHMPYPTTDAVYRSILDECIKQKALHLAKQVQTHLAVHGLALSFTLGNYLVETFVKCGSIEDAIHLFHQLPRHTVMSWTAIILAYTECGRAQDALEMEALMHKDDIVPNRFTFVNLLKACGSISALEEGRKIHAEIRRNGFAFNVFVGSTLINMYGKCGSRKEAEAVFSQLPVRNVVTWNSMLTAYVEQEEGEKALLLYRQMVGEGVRPHMRTYVIAFQACGVFADEEEAVGMKGESTKVIALEIGRALHTDAIRDGANADEFMASTLIGMYGKCGSISEAEDVFVGLPQHKIVTWNVLLSVYVQHKKAKKVLLAYNKMQAESIIPDEPTFVAAVQSCGIFGDNEEPSYVGGRAVKPIAFEIVQALHIEVRQRGFASANILGSTLMISYGKCGSIVDAEHVFKGLWKRDLVTWNAMLSAYVEDGQGERALLLYRQMQEGCVSGEERTLVIVLQACCILAENSPSQWGLSKEMCLSLGQAFHADARKKKLTLGIFFSNTLISMYAKCGDLMKAENVFCEMSRKDARSWCSMLTAYVEMRKPEKALRLFGQLHVEGVRKEKLHYVMAFQACASLAEDEEAIFREGLSMKARPFQIGLEIHALAEADNLVLDVMVRSTLLTMYGKCGALKEAQCIFEGVCQRDMVSYNAMLSAYVEQGLNDSAIELFRQLLKDCQILDTVTLLCILQVCQDVKSEELCRQLHFIIVASVCDASLLLINTLAHAYGSCASMGDANMVFDGLYQGDVVSWTACIAGHAREGDIMVTLHMFEEMHYSSILPDKVTFVSVLSACSHAGLVHEGLCYFKSMRRGHGLVPNLRHFAGLIDLLGRAGDFMKMESLILRMPMKADLSTWLSLLSVCRSHGNKELAVHAFECSVRIQPLESTAYILMSNICAEGGSKNRCEEDELWHGVA